MTTEPIVLPVFVCLRCDYHWVPRTAHPTQCAKCRSPYWDKPRRQPKPANGKEQS